MEILGSAPSSDSTKRIKKAEVTVLYRVESKAARIVYKFSL